MNRLLRCLRFNQTASISTSSSFCSSNKTVLHDYHQKHGGKMVEFAGYQMPVQYGKVGIASSHQHVRTKAGLFDVSHMLQLKFYGEDKIKFFETLIVGDVENLSINCAMLSLYTTEDGGIIDDLICSKVCDEDDYIYVVSNSGCREKDLSHIKEKLILFKRKGGDVHMETMDDHGLIAVQGPFAAKVLQGFTKEDLAKVPFMKTLKTTFGGTSCRLTRCGYTGEDGFEISVHNNQIEELCETLLSQSNEIIQLAGLGARDSLRLEAGLCLYGNDIDETTTPIEAGLAWTIGKRRREKADFPGASVILNQLKNKPKKKRVGLISEGPPPRNGCAVLDIEGNCVGKITSGCPSPTMNKNVSMCYVPISLSKVGTEVFVEVRSKKVLAKVTKMPFIKCNYYIPN